MANARGWPEGLFKRPRSPYWWYKVYALDPETGRKVAIRESTKTTSETKAKKIRVAAIENLAGGFNPRAERIMFADLKTALVSDYQARGNRSLDRARRAFKHLAAAFGRSRAVDITAGRIATYFSNRLEEKAALSTALYELRILKRGFRLLVRRSDLSRVPVFPEMPDPKNARAGFFTNADFAALQVELPEHLRAPAQFGYLTSWRKSEVFGLQWKNVEWDAEVINLDVGTTKSGRGRAFPFGVYPALRELLERQRAYADTVEVDLHRDVVWVFHRQGKPIKDHYAGWRAACKRAGLEGRTFHDLRRSAIRNMVRAGIPKHTAMKLSGHLTASVFDRYDITDLEDLRNATAKLSGDGHTTGTLDRKTAPQASEPNSV